MQKIFLYFYSIALLFSWDTNITSLEANFLQITYQGNEKVAYSGILYAKAPHFAKWVYETPLKKEIYLNGKQVAIYEPILEQATLTTIANKADFFSILHAAKLGDDGNYHATIGDINYTLILKNNKPYKIYFIDEINNKIEITLKNLKINLALEDSIFTFTPTANIDIIKQ